MMKVGTDTLGLRETIGSPEFVLDPYPVYHRLVNEAPVYWSSPTDLLVSTVGLCREVLSDAATFGQRLTSYPNFHSMNPPQHTRLRKLVSRVFTPRAIHSYRHRIEFFADQLITKLESKGEMELVSKFAQPLPTLVITEMLGVPFEDGIIWEEWANAIHKRTAIPEFLGAGLPEDVATAAAQASANEKEYFRELVAERRKNRGDDIVSLLISAEEDGDHLSEDELLYTLILLLGAGHHTSVNLIGNGMRALLQHPDQFDRLRQEPDLINNAIEEMLRIDPPLQAEPRVALKDTEIGGVPVPEGTDVWCMLAAANRDLELFEDPDEFRIDRENARSHLSFSLGIHHCLGAPLARAEGQVAFRLLSERLPNLRLAGTPTYDGLYRLRGVGNLPVVWDVA